MIDIWSLGDSICVNFFRGTARFPQTGPKTFLDPAKKAFEESKRKGLTTGQRKPTTLNNRASESAAAIQRCPMPTVIVQNPTVKVMPFLRHSQPDGTIDSICQACYRPIARSHSKKAILSKEKIHICSPDELSLRAQYGPF